MLKRGDQIEKARSAPLIENAGWQALLTAAAAAIAVGLEMFGWISPTAAMGWLGATTIIALALVAEARQRPFGKPKLDKDTQGAIAASVADAPLLRAALDGVPDILLILDAEATIVYANSAARDFSGKAIVGLPLEYVSREPELCDAVSEVSTSGKAKTVMVADRSGMPRHLEATITPLQAGPASTSSATAKGRGTAVLLLIVDRSAQQRLIDMRADFIANASHELRTPLAAVRGFIETLQGPARRDEAARDRFLNIMSDQAMRMTRLIDDLLLLSRVEERANLAPSGTVELNETLLHVIEVLRPLADAKSATLQFTRLSSRATVTADRDELVQVFVNLIENAIKYGRQSGLIQIVLTATTNRDGIPVSYRVAVTDNGPGIAPDHLPRLTERFYRVSPNHSREIGGTGLGLAIVKHVLHRHQGRLDIQSRVGSGSTFSVTLAAQRAMRDRNNAPLTAS